MYLFMLFPVDVLAGQLCTWQLADHSSSSVVWSYIGVLRAVAA